MDFLISSVKKRFKWAVEQYVSQLYRFKMYKVASGGRAGGSGGVERKIEQEQKSGI
jgi:hypothetical protein